MIAICLGLSLGFIIEPTLIERESEFYVLCRADFDWRTEKHDRYPTYRMIGRQLYPDGATG